MRNASCVYRVVHLNLMQSLDFRQGFIQINLGLLIGLPLLRQIAAIINQILRNLVLHVNVLEAPIHQIVRKLHLL